MLKWNKKNDDDDDDDDDDDYDNDDDNLVFVSMNIAVTHEVRTRIKSCNCIEYIL